MPPPAGAARERSCASSGSPARSRARVSGIPRVGHEGNDTGKRHLRPAPANSRTRLPPARRPRSGPSAGNLPAPPAGWSVDRPFAGGRDCPAPCGGLRSRPGDPEGGTSPGPSGRGWRRHRSSPTSRAGSGLVPGIRGGDIGIAILARGRGRAQHPGPPVRSRRAGGDILDSLSAAGGEPNRMPPFGACGEDDAGGQPRIPGTVPGRHHPPRARNGRARPAKIPVAVGPGRRLPPEGVKDRRRTPRRGRCCRAVVFPVFPGSREMMGSLSGTVGGIRQGGSRRSRLRLPPVVPDCPRRCRHQQRDVRLVRPARVGSPDSLPWPAGRDAGDASGLSPTTPLTRIGDRHGSPELDLCSGPHPDRLATSPSTDGPPRPADQRGDVSPRRPCHGLAAHTRETPPRQCRTHRHPQTTTGAVGRMASPPRNRVHAVVAGGIPGTHGPDLLPEGSPAGSVCR